MPTMNGCGFWNGLTMSPTPTSGQLVFSRRDIPELALDVVRRLPCPDRQNLVDRFHKHRLPVGVEHAQRLGVGAQHAGADAKDEAAFEQVVEHRRIGGDHHRVAMRQVGNRGADLHLPGGVQQRRDEHHAVRDVLDGVGQMLPAIAFGVAKPVGQNERFAILLQSLPIGATLGVNRHGEKAKPHVRLRNVGVCALSRG